MKRGYMRILSKSRWIDSAMTVNREKESVWMMIAVGCGMTRIRGCRWSYVVKCTLYLALSITAYFIFVSWHKELVFFHYCTWDYYFTHTNTNICSQRRKSIGNLKLHCIVFCFSTILMKYSKRETMFGKKEFILFFIN